MTKNIPSSRFVKKASGVAFNSGRSNHEGARLQPNGALFCLLCFFLCVCVCARGLSPKKAAVALLPQNSQRGIYLPMSFTFVDL